MSTYNNFPAFNYFAMMQPMEKSLKWAQNNQPAIIEQLKSLLRIPSISTDNYHKKDIMKAAEWVKTFFESLGLETQTLEGSGNPIVFAQTEQDPKKPTVLFYFHYDVQPSGDETLWTYGAFEPREHNGRLYGRGTADDKMQGLVHGFALQSMIESGEELPVNMKFCIEGEEEISSPNFEQTVKKYKDLIAHDYMIISDGYMPHPDKPNIETGSRGIIYSQIKVSIGNKDLHSGQFGGVVKNANHELARLITLLKDHNGKITIPGFYDDILSPSEAEYENWKRHPALAEEYLDSGETFSLDEGEKGYSLEERNWSRPTMEVNGMWGGFIEKGAKTVIPCEAFAKISFRIVPGQNPDRIIESYRAHLSQLAQEGVQVELQWADKASAFVVDTTDPIFGKVQDAITETFQTEAALSRTGGTIGMLSGVHAFFQKPIVLLNFGCADENAHSPNEFMRLKNFWRGIETSIRLMHKIGS